MSANTPSTAEEKTVPARKLKTRWRVFAWSVVLVLSLAVLALLLVPKIHLSSARVDIDGQPLNGAPIRLKIGIPHTVNGEFHFSSPNAQPDGRGVDRDTIYLTFSTGDQSQVMISQTTGRLTEDGYVLTFRGELPRAVNPQKGKFSVGATDFRQKNQRGGHSTRPIFQNPMEFIP